LERSRQQLNGLDPELAKSFGAAEKKDWWHQRGECDADLGRLLGRVEAGLQEVVGVVLGEAAPDVGVGGDLSSKFAAACNVVDLTEEESLTEAQCKKMTVPALKEAIKERDADFVFAKGLKKADLLAALVGMLGSKSAPATLPPPPPPAALSTPPSTHAVVLVLDERLHRMPFESIPCLSKRTVTRVPSLPFVFSSRVEKADKLVRRGNCFYVLDPENNLPSTRKTLQPVLETYAQFNPNLKPTTTLTNCFPSLRSLAGTGSGGRGRRASAGVPQTTTSSWRSLRRSRACSCTAGTAAGRAASPGERSRSASPAGRSSPTWRSSGAARPDSARGAGRRGGRAGAGR
jgi:hypothetical protein